MTINALYKDPNTTMESQDKPSITTKQEHHLNTMTREQLFRGIKFQIFLEKAIIDLKHNFWHFFTEDFYIFIF